MLQAQLGWRARKNHLARAAPLTSLIFVSFFWLAIDKKIVSLGKSSPGWFPTLSGIVYDIIACHKFTNTYAHIIVSQHEQQFTVYLSPAFNK